jgi:hypothetical protein
VLRVATHIHAELTELHVDADRMRQAILVIGVPM